ncbi:CBS domain-containing protein [Nonomuraea sp. B12E4]|uniref:CBS domain-containing protein n=1 Tax=Nonomuraea sp. B12E4 TaxID=3153564 RepID=UPI00325CE04C
MTTEVASVNGSTPFKDIAEVLIAHGVSAVPVVDAENHCLSSAASNRRRSGRRRSAGLEGCRSKRHASAPAAGY